MEFDKRIPIYEQLKQHYRQQIAAGVYRPGDRLPSRREIATAMKINPNTVQRALKELEEEALIVSEPNVPSVVTSDHQVLKNLQDQLVNQAMEAFYQAVMPLGVDSQSLINALQEYIQAKEGTQHD